MAVLHAEIFKKAIPLVIQENRVEEFTLTSLSKIKINEEKLTWQEVIGARVQAERAREFYQKAINRGIYGIPKENENNQFILMTLVLKDGSTQKVFSPIFKDRFTVNIKGRNVNFIYNELKNKLLRTKEGKSRSQ